MDQEILLSVRKLFIKFLLLQAIILAAAIALSIFFTGHYKYRLAGQLAAASRDALISGDSRRAIMDLTAAVSRDFSGVAWLPSEGDEGFSIPAGADSRNNLFFSTARLRINFDIEGMFPAGTLFFRYPRWPPILWGALAWLAVFALSVPIAAFERRRLIREHNLLVDFRIKESYGILAAQVAHDIRSPLAALEAAAKGLEGAPEQRQVIDRATRRIQGIAEDLLQRYRAPEKNKRAEAAPCDLAALTAQVVEEKSLQYTNRAGLKIEFNTCERANVLAEAKEFQRIVSNLVNNAIEALDGPGRVSVSLSAAGEQVVLEISDNGRGIPSETLGKLGRKGETHGKKGGTGLGLYHARTSVKKWGGDLAITSEPGRGTTITLRLPRTVNPETVEKPTRAVLIDDDSLTHMTWEMAAQANGVELLVFTAPCDFLARIDEFPKDLPIYIDSDLGDGTKGENIAADLRSKGYTALTLATGHLPEKFAHLPWLKVQSKTPPWG